MTKTATAMAITVLCLGVVGLVRIESEPDANAAQQAKPSETLQVSDEQQRCGEICSFRDAPVYVVPNRNSPPARIGGGTRGGRLKL